MCRLLYPGSLAEPGSLNCQQSSCQRLPASGLGRNAAGHALSALSWGPGPWRWERNVAPASGIIPVLPKVGRGSWLKQTYLPGSLRALRPSTRYCTAT
ncbi:unnamed protein product [Ectocarpus sp. 12 AP-2014]